MEINFSNKSQLGSFGEFVYRMHCESLGLHLERTNYCHTDFRLKSEDSGRDIYIDVKSTLSDKNSYQRPRYHNDISYDLIILLAGEVFLVPDKISPLHDKGRTPLGPITEWVAKWLQNTEVSRKRECRLMESTRHDLGGIFANAGYQRLRIVERGDASWKRWSGTVDNLPGSLKVINDYDVTLFIEFGCEDFIEKTSRIYLIWHHLLHKRKIKMAHPSDRQLKKGVSEVIDLKYFSIEHPELVFENIESLKTHIEAKIK